MLPASAWGSLFNAALCARFVHSAIIEHTNKVLYMEDDDIAVVSGGKLSIHRMNRQAGEDPQRAIKTLQMELQQIMKGEKMGHQNDINIPNPLNGSFPEPACVIHTLASQALHLRINLLVFVNTFRSFAACHSCQTGQRGEDRKWAYSNCRCALG